MAQAKESGKPIFVCSGFAGCHWCHRLAHEAFLSGPVVSLISKHCVPLLIDRQVRPDWDAFLMACCQAQGGSGGWPLMALTDGEGRPFWLSTYLPLASVPGRAGLIETLTTLIDYWEHDTSSMAHMARSLAQWVREEPPHNRAPIATAKEGAVALELALEGDKERAPSFMQPWRLVLMAQQGHRAQAARAAMDLAHHPILDPLGGVFRYATEPQWSTPHYEKNARLTGLWAWICAELSSEEELLLDFARSSARWLWRELWREERLFFGSDADSDGIEGGHYLTSREELSKLDEAFWDAFDLKGGLLVAKGGLRGFEEELDLIQGARTRPLALDSGARVVDGLCVALAFHSLSLIEEEWKERFEKVWAWTKKQPLLTLEDSASRAFGDAFFEGDKGAFEGLAASFAPQWKSWLPREDSPEPLYDVAGGETPGGIEWAGALALLLGGKEEGLVEKLTTSWSLQGVTLGRMMEEGQSWNFGK